MLKDAASWAMIAVATKDSSCLEDMSHGPWRLDVVQWQLAGALLTARLAVC